MCRYRSYLLIVILLATSVTVASQSSPADQSTVPAQTEQVVTIAVPFPFSQYSYWTNGDYTGSQWTSAVNGLLYRRSGDNSNGFVPDLADGMPQFTADGLTITVNLKSDLQFATGEPLTADDVVFSYHVALTSDINQNSFNTLHDYLGSKDSVAKVGENTIQFTLTRAYAFAISLLTVPIIDETTFSPFYDNCLEFQLECDWNKANGFFSAGAGPYFVESVDSTNGIVSVIKNGNYWDADNVYADKIIFKYIPSQNDAKIALQNGEVDILDRNYVYSSTDFSGIDGVTTDLAASTVSEEIALNHLNPYYGTGEAIPGNSAPDTMDARYVRLALSHIADRERYVSELLDGEGEPAATSIASGSVGHDDSLIHHSYNLTLAREYMAMAGFDNSKYTSDITNPDATCNNDASCLFSVTLLSPNTKPLRNALATEFESELPKIGIGVKSHESVGWDIIIPRTFGSSSDPLSYEEGGYDMFFYTSDYGLDWDPQQSFSTEGLCGTGSCENFYNYENNTVEQLINEYKTDYNLNTRVQKLGEIQEALYWDIPVIPILEDQTLWASASDITGLNTILLDNAQQNWGDVTKSSWTVNPGNTLDLDKLASTPVSPPITIDSVTNITTATPSERPVVNAAITAEDGVKEVIFSYNTGDEWINDSMTFENGVWTYEIPNFSNETTVKYKVYATTVTGYWTTSDEFSYVVIDTSEGRILGVLPVSIIPVLLALLIAIPIMRKSISRTD